MAPVYQRPFSGASRGDTALPRLWNFKARLRRRTLMVPGRPEHNSWSVRPSTPADHRPILCVGLHPPAGNVVPEDRVRQFRVAQEINHRDVWQIGNPLACSPICRRALQDHGRRLRQIPSWSSLLLAESCARGTSRLQARCCSEPRFSSHLVFGSHGDRGILAKSGRWRMHRPVWDYQSPRHWER